MRKRKEDIYCAWIGLFGTYEDIDEVTWMLKCPCLNPEQAAIKKDLYEKLTIEAKEVIKTILETPAEFVAFCISPKTGGYKQRKNDKTYFIKMYFRKKWKSRLKVRDAFTEVEQFVKKFNC